MFGRRQKNIEIPDVPLALWALANADLDDEARLLLSAVLLNSVGGTIRQIVGAQNPAALHPDARSLLEPGPELTARFAAGVRDAFGGMSVDDVRAFMFVGDKTAAFDMLYDAITEGSS